jgi:ATP phosphoribosyltransferase
LFHSTARLVGHPLSLRLDAGPLQSVVDRLASLSAVVPQAVA